MEFTAKHRTQTWRRAGSHHRPCEPSSLPPTQPLSTGLEKSKNRMSTSALHPQHICGLQYFHWKRFSCACFAHQVVPRRPFQGVLQANLPEERAECSRPWRVTSSWQDKPDSFKVCLTFSWLLHTGRWNSQTVSKPVTTAWTSVTSFLNHTFPSHMEHLSHGSHSRSLTTGVAFPRSSSSCPVFWYEREMKQYLMHGQTIDLDKA